MNILRSQYFILLFALIPFLFSTASLAEQVGPQQPRQVHFGKKFIELCESPNEIARRSCGEVITALLNAHIEMTRVDPSQREICPARTLTAEEARRAFMRWVNLTPEASTIIFPALVMQALRFLYQCDRHGSV